MVLRIDGADLIRANIGPNNDEVSFVELNPGFIISGNVPYSDSGYYKYDVDGTTIIINEVKELELLQRRYMQEVVNKFDELMYNGVFTSSLGFPADNRRGQGKDDKDNIQSLIEIAQEPVYFRDADGGFHPLMTSDLVILKQEMIQDGLNKYQWKWNKEQEIMQALTLGELMLVII